MGGTRQHPEEGGARGGDGGRAEGGGAAATEPLDLRVRRTPPPTQLATMNRPLLIAVRMQYIVVVEYIFQM